jgi:hypothetical protein
MSKCTCHERDSSRTCSYCKTQGFYGHMEKRPDSNIKMFWGSRMEYGSCSSCLCKEDDVLVMELKASTIRLCGTCAKRVESWLINLI